MNENQDDLNDNNCINVVGCQGQLCQNWNRNCDLIKQNLLIKWNGLLFESLFVFETVVVGWVLLDEDE